MTEENKTYSLKPPANITVETNTRPYAYEISLDCTAKGYIQPSIKIRSDSLLVSTKALFEGTWEHEQMHIEDATVVLLDRLVKSLRHSKYKVATDYEDVQKNGKD